jgi:phospholipid transport system transporter-binding protein
MEKLSGKLDQRSVEKLWERKDAIFSSDGADLTEVTSVDSAGVAFLTLWAKNSPAGKLHIRNMPEDAVKLVHLFHTEPLFVFSDEHEAAENKEGTASESGNAE